MRQEEGRKETLNIKLKNGEKTKKEEMKGEV